MYFSNVFLKDFDDFQENSVFSFYAFFDDFLVFLAAQSGEAFGGSQGAKCICRTGIVRNCVNHLEIKQTTKEILFWSDFG